MVDEDLALFRCILGNLLMHLSILPGSPQTTPIQHHLIGDGSIERGLISKHHAFFIPRVSLLDRVTAGQVLGIVTDTLGGCLEEIVSSVDGVIALIHAFRVVKPGDPLFVVTGLAA